MKKPIFYFITILFLSSCIDSNLKESGSTEEKRDSDSSISKNSNLISYGELRGRLIRAKVDELEKVLGKPDLDYSVGSWKALIYFFATEQDQTIGHIRVMHDYNRIDTFDFYQPGARIYVNKWQYINSPDKEQNHYSSIKIQE